LSNSSTTVFLIPLSAMNIRKCYLQHLRYGALVGLVFGIFLDLFLLFQSKGILPPWLEIIPALLTNNALVLAFLFRSQMLGVIFVFSFVPLLWSLLFYLWFSGSLKKIIVGIFILFLNILLPVLFWQNISFN